MDYYKQFVMHCNIFHLSYWTMGEWNEQQVPHNILGHTYNFEENGITQQRRKLEGFER